jgi:hypothetical protein
MFNKSTTFLGQVSRALTNTLAAVSLGFSLSANAAFITDVSAGVENIYSQVNSSGQTIDIRWGLAAELVAPSLLEITTSGEITSLFGNHASFGGMFESVVYFVDDISACGGTTNAPSIIGCGEQPGNDFVVESLFTFGTLGDELVAHELGHNLGLTHIDNVNNLMDSFINVSHTILNAGQGTAIFGSDLVQGDAQSGFFIQLNPVLVVAIATPPITVSEPPILALMLLVLVAVMRAPSKRA